MQAVAKIVPPGERVLNDRGDGSAWMYALTGVKPVAGHYDSYRVGPDATPARRPLQPIPGRLGRPGRNGATRSAASSSTPASCAATPYANPGWSAWPVSRG